MWTISHPLKKNGGMKMLIGVNIQSKHLNISITKIGVQFALN
jgi:hypothetical protein